MPENESALFATSRREFVIGAVGVAAASALIGLPLNPALAAATQADKIFKTIRRC
ncbi:MAG: hypothetical protein WA869_19115 [Alloacidobacterium sp.]